MRIIQASYPHTGSTLLLNMIHGFICPDEGIHWHTEKIDEDTGLALIHLHTVTKTHEVNFDQLTKAYGDQYDLYFLVTERQQRYHPKYYSRKNVVIFKYDEIVETKEASIEQVTRHVYSRLANVLPRSVFSSMDAEATIERGIQRVKDMNTICDQIHDKPFSYYDPFFGIHGHHRGRDK